MPYSTISALDVPLYVLVIAQFHVALGLTLLAASIMETSDATDIANEYVRTT